MQNKLKIIIFIILIFMSKSVVQATEVENIDEIFYLNNTTQTLTLDEYKQMVEVADSTESIHNQEPNQNGYGNIVIGDWKRQEIGTFDFDTEGMINWVWSDLNVDSEWLYEDYEVWDGSRLKYDETTNTYSTAHNFSKHLADNIISADYFPTGSKLYDSATWQYKGEGETANNGQYTLNRFQGTFTLKGSPVGHDYTMSSVAPTGNLYINDDMFVFIYPKGTTLVNDSSDLNYFMNYLCFWGGTTSFSDFHGIKQLESAPIIEGDPYMVLAHQYSMKVVTDNIGDKINYAYALNPWNTEKEFVIDIITCDRSGGGGMYRPKITATARENTADNVDLVFKVVSSNGSDILVSGAAFKMDYRQTWYPVGVSASQLYNIENGYIENTAGNMLISVHPSTLNEKTEDDTADFYMHTLHQIMDAPGYYPTSETWEIFVDIDTDGDRSYIVNGIHGKVEAGCTAYWEGSRETNLPMQIVLTPKNYIISYDFNGGTLIDSSTYTTDYIIEDDVVLPTLKRDDYVFLGWKVTSVDGNWDEDVLYTSGNIGKGQYGNVTLTAEWRKNSSFIIYIPESILLDESGNGTISIDATLENFIDTTEVSVYIEEFDGKLKNEVLDEIFLEYELINLEANKVVSKGDCVAIFSSSDSDEKNIDITLKDIPIYSGSYNEKVTFLVEWNE